MCILARENILKSLYFYGLSLRDFLAILIWILSNISSTELDQISRYWHRRIYIKAWQCHRRRSRMRAKQKQAVFTRKYLDNYVKLNYKSPYLICCWLCFTSIFSSRLSISNLEQSGFIDAERPERYMEILPRNKQHKPKLDDVSTWQMLKYYSFFFISECKDCTYTTVYFVTVEA